MPPCLYLLTLVALLHGGVTFREGKADQTMTESESWMVSWPEVHFVSLLPKDQRPREINKAVKLLRGSREGQLVFQSL